MLLVLELALLCNESIIGISQIIDPERASQHHY